MDYAIFVMCSHKKSVIQASERKDNTFDKKTMVSLSLIFVKEAFIGFIGGLRAGVADGVE